MSVVTRFAPSPTGYLHLGHAYSALIAANVAEALGGRFLLRIEDIDVVRCRPEFEDAIREDLAWLGLELEQPVRRQSEHLADYLKALETLEAQGLIYPCFCTRGAIRAAIARAIAELFRQPDSHLGFLVFGTTMGQWLSLPMLLVGLFLILRPQRQFPAGRVRD